MSSAVNIFNMQNTQKSQKSPVQTQVKSAKQTSDSILSFLNLLQNAAGSGRIENADKFNNFNNSANMENRGKNNVLNKGKNTSDINNAKINLKSSADKNSGLAAALTKVLNGESTNLPEFDETGLAEAVKEVMAGITKTVKDEDGEKIDIGKLLEILGAPAEIIPEMIAAVTATKMTAEADVIEMTANASNGRIQEMMPAVQGVSEITAETADTQGLVSISEAEDFISEAAEYIYSGRMSEMSAMMEASETAESSGALPEQVQENIADFADIIEESVDFKSAMAGYAADKLEKSIANNPESSLRINAENIKEIVRQVLNEEPPEIEVLSAVKLNEAELGKSEPTMLDILNSMRKSVNITQVQTAENNQEIAVNIAQAAAEISADEILEAGKTEANANIANIANDSESADVNNLTGIINARVSSTQSLESEVNIEEFTNNVSRAITEKVQGILNNKGQGAEADEIYELRLRLKPAELGEVFMKISYKNGNVGVNIIAANAAAERAILSQMGDLRASLEAQEINLAEFDVSQFNNYNQNTQSQNSNQSSQNNEKNGRNERANNRSGSTGNSLNNNINELRIAQEAERRETVANYIKSRRIFYKTI